MLTGNPVRPDIVAVRRDPDRSPPLVAVVGGSLGARRVNDAALGLYDRWRDRADVAIHHVTGVRDYESCAARLEALRRPDDALAYELVDYEEHMDTLYARASLAVCRAGAVTVAELAAAGMPVGARAAAGRPATTRPATPRRSCTRARRCSCPTPSATPPASRPSSPPLVPTRRGWRRCRRGARTLARPDAAARLADLVEEVAGAG